MQAIIQCGGNGSRFAKSIGAKTPYPKHLEKIGEKTILQLSVESVLSIAEVDMVTFLLNPVLRQPYIGELRKIRKENPNIKFFETDGPRNEDYISIAGQLGKGIKDLNGKDYRFDITQDAIVCHGDIFLKNQGNMKRLKDDIVDFLVTNTSKKLLDICDDFADPLFLVGRPIDWTNDGLSPHIEKRSIDEYRLGYFNVNTVEILNEIRANRGTIESNSRIIG